MKTSTQLMNHIPLAVNVKDFAEQVNCRRKQQVQKIEALLKELGDEDGPVVIYKKCTFTPMNETHFKLDDVPFENKNIMEHLSQVDNIFAVITSCGMNLHEKTLEKTNMFDQYIMMELCKVSGNQARHVFESKVQENYGLEEGRYFFPGEDGWQLEDGRGIFTLMQKEAEAMRITLNERCMVKPHFSVYGLYCG